jgi:hypothetical protein
MRNTQIGLSASICGIDNSFGQRCTDRHHRSITPLAICFDLNQRPGLVQLELCIICIDSIRTPYQTAPSLLVCRLSVSLASKQLSDTTPPGGLILPTKLTIYHSLNAQRPSLSNHQNCALSLIFSLPATSTKSSNSPAGVCKAAPCCAQQWLTIEHLTQMLFQRTQSFFAAIFQPFITNTNPCSLATQSQKKLLKHSADCKNAENPPILQ